MDMETGILGKENTVFADMEILYTVYVYWEQKQYYLRRWKPVSWAKENTPTYNKKAGILGKENTPQSGYANTILGKKNTTAYRHEKAVSATCAEQAS